MIGKSIDALQRIIDREIASLKRYRELAKEYRELGAHKQAKKYQQQIKMTEATIDGLMKKRKIKQEGAQN